MITPIFSEFSFFNKFLVLFGIRLFDSVLFESKFFFGGLMLLSITWFWFVTNTQRILVFAFIFRLDSSTLFVFGLDTLRNICVIPTALGWFVVNTLSDFVFECIRVEIGCFLYFRTLLKILLRFNLLRFVFVFQVVFYCNDFLWSLIFFNYFFHEVFVSRILFLGDLFGSNDFL